jgi:hypothetical protein
MAMHTFSVRRPTSALKTTVGQTLLEFALVIPLLLTLAFATMELGWAIYANTTINSAAHQSARRGMVLSRLASGLPGNAFSVSGNSDGTYPGPLGCDPATIVGTVGCNLGVLPSSRITVVLSTPNEIASTHNVISGNEIVVVVRYEYHPLIGIWSGLPVEFTMTGNAATLTT